MYIEYKYVPKIIIFKWIPIINRLKRKLLTDEVNKISHAPLKKWAKSVFTAKSMLAGSPVNKV